MKICSICGIEKPIDSFTKDKRKKDGHSSRCKSCHKALSKEYEKTRVYTDEQRNKKREYRRKYQWNEENKLKTKAKWNEKVRLSGSRKEYNKKWKKENIDRVRAGTRKRQAMLAKACPSWADHEKIAYIYAVAKAAEDYFGAKFHVDHIIPLRGKNICGLHVHNNLQVIPATENLRKSNKW